MDLIKILPGFNEMEKVVMINKWFGTSAEIYLHGCHLTSFKIGQNAKEFIYVSKDAVFSANGKIRGGIPVCFPQFADRGKLEVMHGFARSSNEFILLQKEVDILKKELDIKFTLFGKSLLSEVLVSNKDENPFEFTMALHTYFNVPDIKNCRIGGLYGVQFIDKMKENGEFKDNENPLCIDKEVDRIYMDVKHPIEIMDTEKEELIVIEKDGFDDAVVWNPWIEKSKRMGDLPNLDFNKFVCVEIGVVGSPKVLRAGESFKGRMVIRGDQK